MEETDLLSFHSSSKWTTATSCSSGASFCCLRELAMKMTGERWRWWTETTVGLPKDGCTKSGAFAQLWLIWLSLPMCCVHAFKDLIGQGVLDCEQFESWIRNVMPLYLILPVPTSHPFYSSSDVVITIYGTVWKDEDREVFAAFRLIFMDSLSALWLEYDQAISAFYGAYIWSALVQIHV